MNPLSNIGKPFSEADDATIRVLYKAGHSPREIAITLARTWSGIEARLERLGLRKAGKGTKARARMFGDV